MEVIRKAASDEVGGQINFPKGKGARGIYGVTNKAAGRAEAWGTWRVSGR